MNRTHIGLVAALLLAGTAPLIAQPAATNAAAQPAGKARYGGWGVDLAARDLSVKPGDDFWRYANATWIRANPIPADRIGWGVSAVLNDEVEQQLRAIVEQGGTDPVSRQVGDFYASYMDEAGIEARGTAPLRPYLARIAAARSRDDLIRLFATPGYMAPVEVGIIPNLADPTQYMAAAGQSGLGMPNRDYYLREGAEYDRFRAPPIAPISSRCSAWRAFPTPRPKPTGSSPSSARSRTCTGRPSAAATSPRSTTR
jgi:endothelin-converting enzyme/putative endopeptidase